MAASLAMVAPGTPLRDGLERVLHADRGALVVIGDGPEVLSICTGGFLLDAEFSPQRLSELAKMDGAIIVSSDAARIARANVHLMPSANVPTGETGTRHRTAERVARSIDVPVVSVSAAMNLITVYRHDESHVLERVGRVMDRATQGLQSIQRFRERFDVAITALTALEVEDTVTVRDVVAVLQPAEQLVRIAAETAGRLVELGADGQLLQLQLKEVTEGVDDVRGLVLQDYLCSGPSVSGSSVLRVTTDQKAPHHNASDRSDQTAPDKKEQLDGALEAMARLSFEDLLESQRVAKAIGVLPPDGDLSASVEPRGYRILHKLPRFPPTLIDRLVAHLSTFQSIMHASVADLEQVEGVGEARAKSVKEGLARLAESSILERYNA
jgi:diadenylate cyclase